MSDLALVLVVGIITFASRIAFMLKPGNVSAGPVGRFLDVFPLSLFAAIAISGLLAPDGVPAVTPGLAAGIGGLLGAVAFKRSLLGILAVGGVAFYLTRLITGS